MAYNPLKPDKPAGADTPPIYAGDDLLNVRALRDGVVAGFVPGWSFAYSSLSGPPRDVYTWANGVFRLRATLAYTAGLITSLLWEFSENSGAAYAIISTGGTAAVITSAANGNITTADKDVTVGLLLAIGAAQRAAVSNGALNAHAALVGNAAHGLGTMSTQNKNAVDITGGTINGPVAKLLARLTPAAVPLLASGAHWDWSLTPTMVRIAAGSVIPTIGAADDGEMKRIIVIGAGAITISPSFIQWGVGMPIWGTNYTMINMVWAAVPAKIFTTSIPF